MTSSEPPAGLLRRAAERVRAVSQAATPGLWWEDDHMSGDGFVVMADGVRRAHLPSLADGGIGENYPHMDGEQEHNAAWIALVNPQIAGPLADWLEDTAAEMEQRWMYASAGPRNVHTSALAVTRALLGEAKWAELNRLPCALPSCSQRRRDGSSYCTDEHDVEAQRFKAWLAEREQP